MKILLISNYTTKDENDLKSRFDILSYSIYNYLKKYDDIEIICEKCIVNNRSSRLNKLLEKKIYENVDHAILIDPEGFFYKPSLFIRNLRKYVYGAICSIKLNSKYSGGEDILFYFNENLLNKRINSYPLGWMTNDKYLKPNKRPNTINILLGKKCFDIHLNLIRKDKTKRILGDVFNFIKNNKTMKFRIKQLDINKSLLYYSPETSIEFKNKNGIFDEYKVISESNIYFVTNPLIDETILYELGLCNTVIVSPKNYVSIKTIELLEIIIYENTLPWDKIIDKLNDNDIRDKIIENGNTWENGIKLVYNKLNNFDISKKKINKTTKSSKLSDRNKDLEKQIKNKSLQPKLRDKKPVLIQSQLKSKGSRVIQFSNLE